MQRTKSRICGIDCHVGDKNCNGYCKDPCIKAPATYQEEVPRNLFALTRLKPGPSGYVPYVSINRVDEEVDSFTITVRGDHSHHGEAIKLTRLEMRDLMHKLQQELLY